MTIALKMFCMNGATVSGNVDIGLYSSSGFKPASRLVNSGSTAQAGITAIQVFDITDTPLAANTLYFMAVSLDNATGTLYRTAFGLLQFQRALGVFNETPGVFGLPSTATPTAASGVNATPLIGFSTVTLI